MSTHRLLFTVAALFNWSVGVLIVFGNETTWKLFGLPPPHETLFVHLFAVLVVAFGAAYFWIGMDPAGKRPLILFSAAGKLTVFATVVVEYFAGNAPLLLVGPGAGDLVFAILFLRAAARMR